MDCKGTKRLLQKYFQNYFTREAKAFINILCHTSLFKSSMRHRGN